ncbi:MAG: PepSY domain-containing protein [Oscillospiraceae bacterium]|jgi:hypothetical protein|nr:PepSY domain-containing protein [Oscillospiraceae bacterium]
MNKLPYDDLYIREAIDTGLSRVRFTQRNKNEVWMRIEGGKPMKKKLSLALVLAIALALVAVTALAVSIYNAYYEKAAQVSFSKGVFQNGILDTDTENLVKLVDAMVEAGIELDAAKVALLHDASVSDEVKAETAKQLVSGYYGEGRQGALDFNDILAYEWGPFEYWTLEQRAFTSDMMVKYYSMYKPEYGGAVVPGDGDISLDEALVIARDCFKEQYGLTDEFIDEWRFITQFSQDTFEPGVDATRTFTIELIPTGGISQIDEEGEYAVWVLNDGTVTQHEHYPPKGWTNDIAERIAAWMDISRWGRERAIKMGNNPDVVVPDTNLFTVEGFALFAREWAQPLKDAVANGETRRYFPLAEIPYALPTADDITQEEALAIANAAVMEQLGWSEETLACYVNPSVSYRVYDADNPVWRIGYRINPNPTEERYRLDDLARKGDIPWGGSVYIDAKTGEVQSVHQYDDFFDSQHLGEYEPGEFDYLIPEPESFG